MAETPDPACFANDATCEHERRRVMQRKDREFVWRGRGGSTERLHHQPDLQLHFSKVVSPETRGCPVVTALIDQMPFHFRVHGELLREKGLHELAVREVSGRRADVAENGHHLGYAVPHCRAIAPDLRGVIPPHVAQSLRVEAVGREAVNQPVMRVAHQHDIF